MGSGIVKGEDKGAVGFVDKLGRTWHGFEEYEQFNGPVLMPKVREKIVYPVQKVAMCPLLTAAQLDILRGTMTDEDLQRVVGTAVPTMFALMRMDTGKVLYDYSVTDDYTVILNEEFLDTMETGLLAAHPEVEIESCGTLFGGRVAFVNILLDVAKIMGDDSETAFRLMYYNAFGGKSVAAGLHGTRIVCANTLTLAEAQAAANQTLAKFKHVSGAPGRVQAHLVELTELYASIEAHKAVLNSLAAMPMTALDVESFLSLFVDIPAKATNRMETRRTNERDEIRSIFETRPDLQGDMARTRFAMLNAVTYQTEHGSVGKRGVDEAYAYFDSVTGGGRDKTNQRAFRLLQVPDLVAAAVEARDKLKAKGVDWEQTDGTTAQV